MHYVKANYHCLTQALPCTLEHIEANPELQADYTMGIVVGRYNIHHDQFDNVKASGTCWHEQNSHCEYDMERMSSLLKNTVA